VVNYLATLMNIGGEHLPEPSPTEVSEHGPFWESN